MLRPSMLLQEAARLALAEEVSTGARARATSHLNGLAPGLNNDLLSKLSSRARQIVQQTQENLAQYLNGLTVARLSAREERSVYGRKDFPLAGYDFAFTRKKTSNCIHMLISADWSAEEISLMDDTQPSFSAMISGPYKDLLIEVVSLLGEDAVNYPGSTALDIAMVCTIPEQDLSRASRKHRLKSKMQRADVFVALLTANQGSSLASHELDMYTMKTGYESSTFVLDGGGAILDAGLSPSFIARMCGTPDVGRLREIKKALLDLSCGTSQGLEAARDALIAQLHAQAPLVRWSLLLYLRLYLLALARGMISRAPSPVDDPLVSVGRMVGLTPGQGSGSP
jgi:hypothetical protein